MSLELAVANGLPAKPAKLINQNSGWLKPHSHGYNGCKGYKYLPAITALMAITANLAIGFDKIQALF